MDLKQDIVVHIEDGLNEFVEKNAFSPSLINAREEH